VGGHQGKRPPRLGYGFGAPSAGYGGGMENRDRDEREQTARETTSPSKPTHEASTPPGNPDRDEEAIKKAEEGLERAGGGH
jgi:hypothetical protein